MQERVSTLYHVTYKRVCSLQTITDRCSFQINKIIKPHCYRLTAEKLQNIQKPLKERKIKVTKFMKKRIYINEDNKKEVVTEYTKEEIEYAAERHLRNIFEDIECIKEYKLEIKEISEEIITHGAANYQMLVDNKPITTKMRGYKKQAYGIYNKEENRYKKTGTIEPVKEFFENIKNKNGEMPRQRPYIEVETLGITNYRANKKKYIEIGIVPGNIEQKPRIITELALSAYTFQTEKQYMKWDKELKKDKILLGQSIESDYTNKEGKLNYKEMIIEIQKQIEEGKRIYKYKKEKQQHPYKREAEEMKEYIEQKNKEKVVEKRAEQIVTV